MRNKKHNQNWTTFQNILSPFLLTFALIVILWIAGRNFTGDEYLPIRWANFVTPWIICATAGLIALALIQKRYLPMMLLIWSLGLTILNFAPSQYSNHQIAPPSVAKEARSTHAPISVISFNVGRFNRQYGEVSKLLAKEPADIIFLQEVTSPLKLAVELRMRNLIPAYDIVTDKTTGLVLLSRFKVETTNRLPGVLTRYQISHPLSSITLWNVHVPRSIWSTRGQEKVITNLIDDIKRHSGPKIIAGDFNLTPYNDALRQLSRNTTNFATSTIPPFTYPTPKRAAGLVGPWVQIDHIIVSNHFQSKDRKRLENYAGSDHYPISAQLRFFGNAYTGLGKGEGGSTGEG